MTTVWFSAVRLCVLTLNLRAITHGNLHACVFIPAGKVNMTSVYMQYLGIDVPDETRHATYTHSYKQT